MPEMLRAYRAELFKLSRRPLVLVLLVITITNVWAYVANYVGLQAMNAQGIHSLGYGTDLSILLPHQLVESLVVDLFDVGPPPDTGAVLGVVLGAMIVGSDYLWGTIQTELLQQSGRLAVFSGQVMALAVTLTLFVVLDFAIAGLGSMLVAVMAHAAMRPPPLDELVHGVATVWLIMAAWASLGVLLTTITRGPTAAMGLGITWIAVIEGMIQPFGAHIGAIQALVQWLPKANTDSLVADLTPIFSASVPSQSIAIDPAHATWVLVAYTLVFLTLAAAIFQRRDIA